jgi:shikimate 5-dehydrogenase
MAASVMLGVASEAALYRLLDSFKKSIHVNPRAIEKAEKLENKISTTDKFKVVYDEIQDKKKDLEPSLAEVIEYNLNGIFNLIRLQRNESGHPTGTRPDKDQMYANLIVFIMYCKTLYDLIKWLEH